MRASPGDDGIAAAACDARATQKMAFERSLARSIEDLIVPIAGPGRARVQVTADLDFDKRQTTSETFADPDQAPVVNEVTSAEPSTGAGGAVGGVLGPDATPIPGDPAPSPPQTQTQPTPPLPHVPPHAPTPP